MKKLFVILVLLFLSIIVNAQDKKFNFEFDYAQFAYDSSSNYIEFYYSFGQESLLRSIHDSTIHLEGILHVEVLDSLTGQEVLNKDWKISYSPKDTSDFSNSLVGVIGFSLPSGKYEFLVTGEDSLQSSFSKSAKEYLTVRPFIGNNISMSDLQFASKILQDSPNKTSIFYKNTYEVIPSPTSVYDDNEPVLFYYLELYNLNGLHNGPPLKMSTLVYNSKEQMVYDKVKTIVGKVNSRVEVGAVPVNKFSTGSYTLIIALIDSIGNYGLSSSKRFFVYNPSVQATDSLYNKSATNILATQFGIMSEEELDDLFDKSKYIATATEIKQYSALTNVDGKRKFINQFWNARDTNPSTPRNEFYIEYLKRIQHCNQTFNALGKEGWKTDRGRIYLKYGEPSEIERFPNLQDTKPYEIWHYNDIQGGVIFVFADLTNYSDYELINSTARGELRDDNWQNRISTL
jgi:GWxTD domain-containing protein